MRAIHTGFGPTLAVLIALTAWVSTSALAATTDDATTTIATGTTAPATSLTPSPPPAAAFASIPAIRDVVLSPGGTRLAWLDATQGEPRIIFYDINTEKITRIQALEAGITYRWLGWSDDSTLLYIVSRTEVVPARTGKHTGPDITREIYRMFATEATQPSLRMMLKSDPDFYLMTGLSLLRLHTSTPNTVLVETSDWSEVAKQPSMGTLITGGRRSEGWIRTVYSVDTRTGKGTRLELGDQYTYRWLIDHDGKILGRTEWYPQLQSYSVLVKHGTLWSEIYKVKTPTPIETAGLDNAGSALLSIQPDTDGRRKLWSLPLDGSPRRVTAEDPNLDVESAFYDPASGELQGVHLVGAQRSRIWFDKNEQQRQEMLWHSFAKFRCQVVSESANKRLVIIRVSNASTPPSFYLVDHTTHEASLVGEEYPKLTGVKLGEVTTFNYKAHDGTGITSYLTLPPGAPPLPPPVIVLPHGGPYSRDVGDDFEWLRQYFATHGYAVFQPQFRGSTGFGEAFERAGDRQWGLVMQDDLTDGVRALIDQGKVDPRRVCIVGYSYNSGYAGYTALAGVAFTPDLFKCAISVNGISDLPRYLGFQAEIDGPYSNIVAYWREHLGERGDPHVIDKSPIKAVNQITAPVLLLYSAGDSVVPAIQSQSMAESLKSAGKTVQIVEILDTDHSLSHTAARVQSLEEMDKFLRDHL